MKLSVYREAKPIPSSREEKRVEAFKTSSPYLPEVLEINTDNDLINAVTTYVWSPSVFKGLRKKENFLSADFIALDIDDGLTITEAEKRVQQANLCCLCLPSPSHKPDAPRFRLIFPLAMTIFSEEIFDETWNWLAKLFPELDPACRDTSRFFFSGTLDDGFWQPGEMLIPQKPIKVEEEEARYNVSGNNVEVGNDIESIVEFIYGQKRNKVPEIVSTFIKEAHTGLPGQWINHLNTFCFTLSLTGIEEDIIMEVCEKLAPNPLDSKDLYQIKRSIRDGIKHRSEEVV